MQNRTPRDIGVFHAQNSKVGSGSGSGPGPGAGEFEMTSRRPPVSSGDDTDDDDDDDDDTYQDKIRHRQLQLREEEVELVVHSGIFCWTFEAFGHWSMHLIFAFEHLICI